MDEGVMKNMPKKVDLTRKPTDAHDCLMENLMDMRHSKSGPQVPVQATGRWKSCNS